MSRDHRKLRAFGLADALVVEVYRVARDMPSEERFELTAQLRRGAVSIATNIVEGSARTSHRESLHYLNMAFGSVREVSYLIDLTARLELMPVDSLAVARHMCDETAKTLGGLMNALRSDAMRDHRVPDGASICSQATSLKPQASHGS